MTLERYQGYVLLLVLPKEVGCHPLALDGDGRQQASIVTADELLVETNACKHFSPVAADGGDQDTNADRNKTNNTSAAGVGT